ncbi:MAG: RIP metalloprotease RseP [Rhodanobacteraceae bacterium]
MSEILGSVWWLIVTLGVLITFHEFGHFVVARRCGVKVLRFSVGFGKPLWSRRDRHGTEFAIAAVPLGGYVKMLDEHEGEVAANEIERAYNRKPVLQRMAISAAGPAFNLLFAVAAFWLMFVIGKPDYLPVLGPTDALAASAGLRAGERITRIDDEQVKTWTDASLALAKAAMDRRDVDIAVVDAQGRSDERTLALSRLPADQDEGTLFHDIGLMPAQIAVPPVVGTVQPGSAAARAGLKPGDRIVAIDGDPIDDWRDLQTEIPKRTGAGTALALDVLRSGRHLAISAQPVRQQRDGHEAWILGVTAEPVQAHYDTTLRYGPFAAFPAALAETWHMTRDTLDMLWKMVSGNASLKNISGVITIAQYANTSAQMGFAWFLSFLALISLSLAIMNLLPIPVLDGGHLLYYLIELVKGSPVSERVQIAGQYVGLTALVALMGLAFYNDILRIAS